MASLVRVVMTSSPVSPAGLARQGAGLMISGRKWSSTDVQAALAFSTRR